MTESQENPILFQPLDAVETWVFDLDNTLYPASSRLFDQVDRKITQFIMQALDLEWGEAHKKQKAFFREYGTTLNGMMQMHGTQPEEYLDYVHNIDLSPIPHAPDLGEALEQLPGRKVIFTNGSTDHAKNVMQKLGVTRHFDGIFDIVDCQFTPKPERSVYEKMIKAFDINPLSAVMIEDMARNLAPAAALGMTTVWVRTDTAWAVEGSDADHIHHIIDDLAPWLKALVAREREQKMQPTPNHQI